MFYIVDANNICVAVCDMLPDEDDLKFRSEQVVESQEDGKLGCILVDGSFQDIEKTGPEKLSDFIKSVQLEVNKVSSVGLQCYMSGIDFPTDWKVYRESLIALSKVQEYSEALALPTKPPLPDGVSI